MLMEDIYTTMTWQKKKLATPCKYPLQLFWNFIHLCLNFPLFTWITKGIFSVFSFVFLKKKKKKAGSSQWFSGWDSVLSLLRAWVQSWRGTKISQASQHSQKKGNKLNTENIENDRKSHRKKIKINYNSTK